MMVVKMDTQWIFHVYVVRSAVMRKQGNQKNERNRHSQQVKQNRSHVQPPSTPSSRGRAAFHRWWRQNWRKARRSVKRQKPRAVIGRSPCAERLQPGGLLR